ncbi:recombination protein RecR [Neisseriaceae bacterium PsAf]|nr:recombination protein RecR [Neisseriaceae bacterium PsAf]MCV2503039.1 recombination mediator RecR [Neisseriaceae bacterium]
MNAFDELAQALEILPNIGTKSAQRIAYYLLQHNREGTEHLIQCLENALKQVKHCRLCNTFCEHDICDLCADQTRDQSQLMIVQMPLDISILESANCHQGLYFVLMGSIQPLQNMDLNSIAIKKLLNRLHEGDVKEIIIATNFNAEGEATAFILQEILKKLPFKVTRLARGMPLGSELEYTDLGTLAQSFYERTPIGKEK